MGRRAALLAVVACLVAVATTGCSPDRPEPGQRSSPSSPTTPPSPTTPSPSATSETGSASPSPTRTLAYRNTRVGGSRTDGPAIRVEIYALRRDGELAVLEFGVRNRSTEPTSLGRTLSAGEREFDASGVTLYDPATELRSSPAESGGECVCSTDLDSAVIEPGATQLLTATFGAPRAGVRTLDVRIPTAGTFTEVAVEE
ncbi:MAG: hypothetical protein GEV10_15080 [Streptosporangiales bacterium]|nr:hypothetical protein [Streptosporangiales bacterium]